MGVRMHIVALVLVVEIVRALYQDWCHFWVVATCQLSGIYLACCQCTMLLQDATCVVYNARTAFRKLPFGKLPSGTG